MRNNEKGMSLMAWTVTVIVLVILAFILVAMFTGLGDVVEEKQSANETTVVNEKIEENTEVEDENVDTEEENTEAEVEETNTEDEEANTETEENGTDSNEVIEE